MNLLALTPTRAPGTVHFSLAGAHWFTRLELHTAEGAVVRAETGAEEAGLLVLSGTFDLQAGATSWGGRGARTSPLGAKPIAIFVPPATPFAGSSQQGSLLVVGCRQVPDQPKVEGKAALSHKPLLQMAGANKAYDPNTGEWRNAESFPSSPELIAPRRIERIEHGSVVEERVFPADYKTSAFTLGELHFQGAASLELPLRPDEELLLFVRSEGKVTVGNGTQQLELQDCGACVAHGGTVSVTAAGPAFVVMAHAPKAPRL
ncbi:MAG: hypothetical protein RL148_1400 [Planctomycetota bacterium]|jgi:hypothetical protein